MKSIDLSEIKKSLIGFDLFICDSSFESRCLEVASRINTEQFKEVIICHFEDNYEEAITNLEKLKELFINYTVVILRKNDPLANYDKIYDEIIGKGFDNALFDISTFTRENFLIILQLFRQNPFQNINLTLCYNPSDKYSSLSGDELGDLWLSKGVQSIRAVLGYSGDFSPIKGLLLIILVGFEAERAQIILDNFEPDVLYIGKASYSDSGNSELWRVNKYNFDKILKTNSNANEFEFSCKDVDLTVNALCEIISANKDKYNIVISPLNNKISTLAVASTVFRHPEVQICYASTNLYNINAYSTPSNYIHVIDADEL